MQVDVCNLIENDQGQVKKSEMNIQMSFELVRGIQNKIVIAIYLKSSDYSCIMAKPAFYL